MASHAGGGGEHLGCAVTERRWLGAIFAGAFLAGSAVGEFRHRARSRTVAVEHDAVSEQVTARSEQAREVESVASADDTGTERIERVVTKPDGTVAKTDTTRTFHWRRMAQAQEHEEQRAETQTVVKVVHDTKVVTEVRERHSDWSAAAFVGLNADRDTLIAAQLGRRILGPFEAVIQVQASPHLGHWAAFAGVGARW